MNNTQQLEAGIDYEFKDKKLLVTAVTHSSYVKEHCKAEKKQ